MSLYPRKLRIGTYLLLHQRIRTGELWDHTVITRCVIRRDSWVIKFPYQYSQLRSLSRLNSYRLVAIDGRFFPGRYWVDGEAVIGGREVSSTTRHTDYFDVLTGPGSGLGAIEDVRELTFSPRLMVAVYLGAMESASILGMMSGQGGVLEDACLQDSAAFDALLKGETRTRHALTRSGEELIARVAPSTVVSTAYELLDLPLLLRLVSRQPANR